VEVGNMLGVQQMIGGSIGKVGNIYTVSARVIDVGTGKLLKSANYDHIGDIGQLMNMGMKVVESQLTLNSVELSPERAGNITETILTTINRKLYTIDDLRFMIDDYDSDYDNVIQLLLKNNTIAYNYRNELYILPPFND